MLWGYSNHTSEHAATGPGVLHLPHVGRIAVTLFAFLVIRTALGVAGVAETAVPALVCVVIGEVGYFALKRRRRKRQHNVILAQQAELHDLNEREVAWRIAEAEASGAFDRWKPKR
jgi:hypothetical protein